MIWLLLLAMLGGIVIGYLACSFGTWSRLHAQESEIRALSVAIGVMMDMNDEVPPGWVQDQLDSMVAKEFR